MFFYHVFHLTLASEFELPELLPSQAPADIIVKFARISEEKPDANPNRRSFQTADGQGSIHFFENLGKFKIVEAREIWVDPLPTIDLDELRAYVLGPILGVLLHLRGYLIFHASCVALKHGAVAFLGVSGQGKSTLCSFLNQRGYPLIADDKLMVQISTPGPITVIPEYPQLKLWPDTATALGLNLQTLPNLYARYDKKAYRLSAGFSQRTIPLAALYCLAEAETLAIEPLAGPQAFFELSIQRYVAPLLKYWGESIDHFRQIGQILAQIPLYRLSRPRRFDCMPDVINALETQHQATSAPLTPRI